ncbi:MAG: hypothetical protein ACJ746_19065 [Bryobacteraceae bacterium]
MRTHHYVAICHSLSNRITGALTLLPLIVAAAIATAFPAFDGNENEHWVGTWAAAVHEPDLLLPGLSAYDSGDHVHPTDEGYKAMADAIDLTLFRNGDHR